NRNFTLMYTLGQFVVSADDDMRPYALIEDSPESLTDEEVSRGKLVHNRSNGFTRKSYDILASFKDVLGKTAAEVPANYERGELRTRRFAGRYGDGSRNQCVDRPCSREFPLPAAGPHRPDGGGQDGADLPFRHE